MNKKLNSISTGSIEAVSFSNFSVTSSSQHLCFLFLAFSQFMILHRGDFPEPFKLGLFENIDELLAELNLFLGLLGLKGFLPRNTYEEPLTVLSSSLTVVTFVLKNWHLLLV